jgi:hypothetical protein
LATVWDNAASAARPGSHRENGSRIRSTAAAKTNRVRKTPVVSSGWIFAAEAPLRQIIQPAAAPTAISPKPATTAPAPACCDAVTTDSPGSCSERGIAVPAGASVLTGRESASPPICGIGSTWVDVCPCNSLTNLSTYRSRDVEA